MTTLTVIIISFYGLGWFLAFIIYLDAEYSEMNEYTDTFFWPIYLVKELIKAFWRAISKW